MVLLFFAQPYWMVYPSDKYKVFLNLHKFKKPVSSLIITAKAEIVL